MDKKTKTLLYFKSMQQLRQSFAGAKIQHYHFKAVKNNRDIILGECHFYTALSWIMYQKYYKNIEDAQNDFDILWQCENQKLIPIKDPFSKVADSYHSLAKKGFKEEEINSMILKHYNENQKVKKLK